MKNGALIYSTDTKGAIAYERTNTLVAIPSGSLNGDRPPEEAKEPVTLAESVRRYREAHMPACDDVVILGPAFVDWLDQIIQTIPA